MPDYDPILAKVSINKASNSDIKKFGSSFSDNPFLEPKTLLRGKLYEFYILKLDFNLPDKTRVDIQANIMNANKTDIAKIYTQYSFIEFWENNSAIEPENDAVKMRKITTINRYCIPSLSYIENKGKTTLFVPFISKYPMFRPANIEFKISLGSGEEFIYTATLE